MVTKKSNPIIHKNKRQLLKKPRVIIKKNKHLAQRQLKKNKIGKNTLNKKQQHYDEQLAQHYYDPKQPGSYSGLASFENNFRQQYPQASKKTIKNWILNQDTYTLHKSRHKKFARNRIIVYGIDDTWQVDLIDLRNLSYHNQGYKYLVSIIDVFSKYAWVIPIKDKTNLSLINVFKQVFTQRKPKKMHTDQGKEFVGKDCQAFLKDNNVSFYILHSEMKASIVERFNRTIKEKMWRFFTAKNTKRYVDIIDDLVYSYNHSYHRSIRMRPVDVTHDNESDVFFNLYGYHNIKDRFVLNSIDVIDKKFNVGDLVRLSQNKNIFEKGFTPNWTEEIFIISEFVPRPIPVYRIKDQNGEDIKGVFYTQELQRVIQSDYPYKIEKIIRTRHSSKKGETEFLVKWHSLPSDNNSWIKSTDIQ